MIIVTLGTQKFQMNRLIKAIDEVALEIEEEIFVQTGNSTYIPKNCKHQDFVDSVKFKQMVSECSILITHSGVGSIMTGINAGRPVIVVPRLAAFHEHVDDHQVQIAEAFASKKCVVYCKDLGKLPHYIKKAKQYHFEPYEVKGGKIEDIILDFIHIFE